MFCWGYGRRIANGATTVVVAEAIGAAAVIARPVQPTEVTRKQRRKGQVSATKTAENTKYWLRVGHASSATDEKDKPDRRHMTDEFSCAPLPDGSNVLKQPTNDISDWLQRRVSVVVVIFDSPRIANDPAHQRFNR